jgi:hypothetical protein
VPDDCFEALRDFLARSPAARKATRPLSPEARVNLLLPGGPASFGMAGGAPALAPGACEDPDFTLTLPEEAVRRITSLGGEDVGEHGVEFFRLALERDPALKVRVQVQASTARLLARGYLGVLALGGLQLSWWLLRVGVRNPAAAIDRLRGRR